MAHFNQHRRRRLFNLCAALALTGTAHAQTRAAHRRTFDLGFNVRPLTAEELADAAATAGSGADEVSSPAKRQRFLPDAVGFSLAAPAPGYFAVPGLPNDAASGPYTYVALANGNFSVAANWSPAVQPPSGPTLGLIFPSYDAIGYTATNDLGNPFLLNSASLLSFSTAQASVSNLTGNQLQFAGTNPTLTIDGSGTFGNFGNNGNGLALNPMSGTTTIGGAGSGSVTLGTTGLSGTGGLDIELTGNGTVRLSAPATGGNTFTGGTILGGGTLAIATANAFALGPMANTLTINGGFLASTSTAATLNNPVTLNSTLVFSQGLLTLSGAVSGTGGIQSLNGTATFGGAFATTLTLNSGGALPFTGAVTIQNGVPRFTTGAGAIVLTAGTSLAGSAGTITLGDNGILSLAGNNVHLPNHNNLVLNGGRVSAASVANSAYSETFGTVTASGLNTVLLTAGATSNALTFGNYTPAANATLEVRGPFTGAASPAGTLTFANGLTPVSDPSAPAVGSGGGPGTQYAGVVPFAAGYSLAAPATGLNAFVTYTAAGVSYILNTDGTQVAQIGAGTAIGGTVAYKNVNLTGGGATAATAITVTGTQRINALSNSATTNIFGAGTLTVSSGAVVVGANFTLGSTTGGTGSTPTGPTLDFGAATGYIHLGAGVTVTGTGGITGTGGLVVSGLDSATSGNGSGGNTFALNFNSAQAGTTANPDNPFTGGLTVNGNALVVFYRDTQLGATYDATANPQGVLNLNGGGLFLNSVPNPMTGLGTAVTVSRPLNIGAAGGNLYANSLAGTSLSFSGAVTGSGALSIGNSSLSAAGPVAFTGDTSGFSGPIFVLAGGVLNAASDASLGSTTAPLNLTGGTLQFTAGGTFNKPINQIGTTGSTLNTLGNNVTLAAPLAGTSVSSGGGFSKQGAGTLTLAAANSTFAGPLKIAQGTLALGNNAALPQVTSVQVLAGTVSGQAGGTFAGSGSVGGTINVNAAGTGLGGVLNPGDPAVANSTGVLSARRITLGAGATYVVDLNGNTLGTQYDDVAASNLVTLTGAMLTVNVGFVPTPGQTFTIVNNLSANAVVGTFANLPEGALVAGSGGNSFYISYVGGDGNDVVLTDVPEPGAAARTLIGGAALLAGAAWRRRRVCRA